MNYLNNPNVVNKKPFSTVPLPRTIFKRRQVLEMFPDNFHDDDEPSIFRRRSDDDEPHKFSKENLRATYNKNDFLLDEPADAELLRIKYINSIRKNNNKPISPSPK